MARALGGTVAKNPQGWVLGRIETDNHSPAPWMGTAPSRMSLHAAHKEQVTALPRGGVALAGTAQVPNGHVTVGPKVFTTQYHPELSRAFMAELIDEMAPDLPPDLARTARESLKDSTDERLMAQWIARFVGGA